jgi:sugar lactone lactonase YvrE
LGLGLAVVIGYGLFGPDRIPPSDPWTPPAAPELTGVLAPNAKLERARPLARGKIVGPESVTRGPDGKVYSGLLDGSIARIDEGSDKVEVFARTGTASEACGKDPAVQHRCGRPLGVRFDKDGTLFVCDTERGLLSFSREGRMTVLSTSAKGVAYMFTDDLDIASDGTIYFTDASSKYGTHHYRDDIMENRPHGRLLRYRPQDKRTDVLLGGLYFANGVQLAPDESYVLVAETTRYRIRRYHLSGPKAGSDDIFADNLPGFPDNIRRGSANNYWVALGAKRNPLLDTMHAHPSLKSFVLRVVPLQTFEDYVVPKIGLVISLDENGKIVDSLWDQGGSAARQVAEADEIDGKLYIGSPVFDRIAVLDLTSR